MTSPTWFDRVTRYRVAATFLYVPFVLTLIGQVTGFHLRDMIGMWGVRGLYYTGLVLLTVALALDAYEVYAGKRRVKQMISQKKRSRKTPGKHAKAG